MKKLIYILMPTLIITTGSILFHSCSADDEDYDAYDLSINTQITRVSRTSPEIQSYNDSDSFYKEGECGIWCILKIQGKTSSYPTYYDVCSNAKTLGWPDDGETPLYGDQIRDLGNMYNIGFTGMQSNHDKNGNYIGGATNKLNEILRDGNYDSNHDGTIDHVILSINDNTHYVVLKCVNKDDASKIDVYDANANNYNKIRTIPRTSVSGIIF